MHDIANPMPDPEDPPASHCNPKTSRQPQPGSACAPHSTCDSYICLPSCTSLNPTPKPLFLLFIRICINKVFQLNSQNTTTQLSHMTRTPHLRDSIPRSISKLAPFRFRAHAVHPRSDHPSDLHI
ncbi:hypothetical protein MA16_Dca021814 [Dendrobium catenatum]|uniref:Uncharacterized protein n=1 Tax=Dendrobium catenatum TaxID=906689 RepID=A0A2I0X4U9_9ASPA|nr:hypothetical protein MA16_Dca021814 [Dendrobium catenatum]